MYKYYSIGLDGLAFYVDEKDNRCIVYDYKTRNLYVGEFGGMVQYYLRGVDINLCVSSFDLVQHNGRYLVHCGDWGYELFPDAVVENEQFLHKNSFM